MIDELNMKYDMICGEILAPTLRQLALSFSVSTSMFYDLVHDLSFSEDRFMFEAAEAYNVTLNDDDCVGYDRIEETVRSRKKLYRMMGHLAIEPDIKIESNQAMLTQPMIYGKCLYEAMLSTYATVAEKVGDNYFGQIDVSMMKRALQVEERTGFTFSEMATLACLYMAFNKSSIEVLNKPAETNNQKKRLRGRMKLIKKWLFSERYKDALFRILSDLLAESNQEKYDLLLEGHCRAFWLPEDKRGLKHIEYAMERYATIKVKKDGKTEEIPVIRLHTPPIDADGENEDAVMQELAEKMCKCRFENAQIDIYQQFFYQLLPIAELISDGTIPKGLVKEYSQEEGYTINLKPYIIRSEKRGAITRQRAAQNDDAMYIVDRYVYLVAEKIASILDTYVDAVIISVVDFLNCLPESRIAGDELLIDYLKRI